MRGEGIVPVMEVGNNGNNGFGGYGNGDWAHRYIVKSLTASEMIWIAKDNAEDVSVYVRCQIPEELLDEE